MSLINEIADYVISAEFDVDDHIGVHLLDTITAIVTGSYTKDFKNIKILYNESEYIGRSGILDEISLWVSAARLSETDDIHTLSCTTPGAIVWPTALLLGRNLSPPPTAEDLASAVNVGYNIITSFGESFNGPFIVYKGIWPTLLASTVGTAAVSSRLLGLGRRQTANALSLALTTSYSVSIISHKALPARWLTIGRAASMGVFSALAARRGFTSNLSIIEDKTFENAYNITLDKSKLLLKSDVKSIKATSLKEYCSAKQAISSIEAFNKFLSSGIKPSNIKEIKVFTPTIYTSMVSQIPNYSDRLASITSVPYQLAAAGFKPNILYDVKRYPVFFNRMMHQFLKKVKVLADKKLDKYYPRRWPAKVYIDTGNEILEHMVVETRGDVTSEYSLENAVSKFNNLTRNIMKKSEASKILKESLRVAENLKNFSGVTNMVRQFITR